MSCTVATTCVADPCGSEMCGRRRERLLVVARLLVSMTRSVVSSGSMVIRRLAAVLEVFQSRPWIALGSQWRSFTVGRCRPSSRNSSRISTDPFREEVIRTA